VHIGAADGSAIDADQDVVDADGGDGNLIEPQTGLGFSFDERFH
jgi:hypothetical protein